MEVDEEAVLVGTNAVELVVVELVVVELEAVPDGCGCWRAAMAAATAAALSW